MLAYDPKTFSTTVAPAVLDVADAFATYVQRAKMEKRMEAQRKADRAMKVADLSSGRQHDLDMEKLRAENVAKDRAEQHDWYIRKLNAQTARDRDFAATQARLQQETNAARIQAEADAKAAATPAPGIKLPPLPDAGHMANIAKAALELQNSQRENGEPVQPIESIIAGLLKPTQAPAEYLDAAINAPGNEELAAGEPAEIREFFDTILGAWMPAGAGPGPAAPTGGPAPAPAAAITPPAAGAAKAPKTATWAEVVATAQKHNVDPEAFAQRLEGRGYKIQRPEPKGEILPNVGF